MLKSWLTFRHISAALHAGKLDEAWQLLADPVIRQNQKAREYLLRCGIGFMARAKKLGKDNIAAALKDLTRAQEAGVEESNINLVKSDLLGNKMAGVRQAMEQGQPAQALTLINALRLEKLAPSLWEEVEEMARAWLVAREQAQRGEFAQAIACIEKYKAKGFASLTAQHAEWVRHQDRFPKLCDELHRASEQQQWRQVVKLSDELLGMAPEHVEVRKARTKAWRMLEPPTMVHGATPQSEPVKPAAASQGTIEEETPRRLLCWIDGVGGYLLCLSSKVSLGRATGDAIGESQLNR